MAPLYIYALTDRPVEAWSEQGRTVESIQVEGIFAVCERRPLSPPLSEEELRRQHDIVLRIGSAVPAVLPARFGSLVDDAELAAIVRVRAKSFREALDLVRGNVQMTIRIEVEKSSSMKAGAPPTSGRAYLEQRLKDASPAVPSRAEASLQAGRPFVLDERRRFSDAGLVTIYQLVPRRDVEKYKEGLDRVRVSGMSVTGPWPPFAFVPEPWS